MARLVSAIFCILLLSPLPAFAWQAKVVRVTRDLVFVVKKGSVEMDVRLGGLTLPAKPPAALQARMLHNAVAGKYVDVRGYGNGYASDIIVGGFSIRRALFSGKAGTVLRMTDVPTGDPAKSLDAMVSPPMSTEYGQHGKQGQQGQAGQHGELAPLASPPAEKFEDQTIIPLQPPTVSGGPVSVAGPQTVANPAEGGVVETVGNSTSVPLLE